MTDIAKDMVYMEFYRRENTLKHASIESEMHFYELVKQGNIDEVKKACSPLDSEGFGILSNDALRNLKYHVVITVAFVTRFCVEGGMERETAYNLSDLYIMKIDKARSNDEVYKIHMEMICDFTERMKKINQGNACSKPIVLCYEYVYYNLNKRIKVKDIAKSLGLSVPYLSKLFHQETGMLLSDYIMKKRIETAEQMLKYSDYEAVDIANFLAFSSHSHFIKVFRESIGITPYQYRKKYYHVN